MGKLLRVVKLPLQDGKKTEFKSIYEYGRKVVLSKPGCYSLRMFADKTDPNVIFTISEWADEAALNEYRTSLEFRGYWPEIKSLLKGKPEANSLEEVTPINQEI